MKIQATFLLDNDFSDIDIFPLVVQALQAHGHDVEYVRYTGTLAHHPLANFDVPCDLHFMGMHYVRPPFSTYRAAELPRAGKVVYYIYHDGHQPVDCTNIQPIVTWDRAGETIQCPYGVRPWFIRECAGLPELSKDIDILWCGKDWQAVDGRWRHGWLDEFQSLLPPSIRLHQYGRIFEMRGYAELIKRSKICLSLWGLAETCYRYWESMWLETCVVGQRFIRERPWRDIHEVMPNFVTPQEATVICMELLATGNWEEVAARQNAWYHQNYNESTYRTWANETVAQITGD